MESCHPRARSGAVLLREESTQNAVEESRGKGVAESRRRILVIDDEPMLGQTLRFAFEGQYEVVVLNSGHDALEHLEHDAGFDLVLCDLMMPVFSGIMVYEAIAQRHPALVERFVFITGGAFTDSARDFLDSYPGLRLEKPFHVRDVETLLELSLERSARA